MNKNKHNKLIQQYRKKTRRAKLKRIQKEIATEIIELGFPNLDSNEIMSGDNIYSQRAKEGKFIDGTPMTPEKLKIVGQVMSHIFQQSVTTPEQKDQLIRMFRDLNKVNRELFPGKCKETIYVDF
jgi:hypothetical protein